MEAIFKLRKMVGVIAHVADVAVTAEVNDFDEVSVSDDAFMWRRQVYGPNAIVEMPGDDVFIHEAVAGARYTLGWLARTAGGYRVIVTEIVPYPVDTSPGDVQVAAALAVGAALSVELHPPPYLTKAGAVFPDMNGGTNPLVATDQ